MNTPETDPIIAFNQGEVSPLHQDSPIDDIREFASTHINPAMNVESWIDRLWVENSDGNLEYQELNSSFINLNPEVALRSLRAALGGQEGGPYTPAVALHVSHLALNCLMRPALEQLAGNNRLKIKELLSEAADQPLSKGDWADVTFATQEKPIGFGAHEMNSFLESREKAVLATRVAISAVEQLGGTHVAPGSEIQPQFDN